MCGRNCPCPDVTQKTEWNTDTDRAWRFETGDKTFTTFKDCVTDTDNYHASIPFQVWATEFREQTNFFEISEWLALFENEFECAGYCAVADFYWQRPISEGKPKRACAEDITSDVTAAFKNLGLTALISGVLLFLMFVFQYCLWRKRDY